MTRGNPESLVVVCETPAGCPRFQRCDVCGSEVVIAIGGFDLWYGATATVWRYAGFFEDGTEKFWCGMCISARADAGGE